MEISYNEAMALGPQGMNTSNMKIVKDVIDDQWDAEIAHSTYIASKATGNVFVFYWAENSGKINIEEAYTELNGTLADAKVLVHFCKHYGEETLEYLFDKTMKEVFANTEQFEVNV